MRAKCDHCGAIFQRRPSELRDARQHFCTRACRTEFRRKSATSRYVKRRDKHVHRIAMEKKLGRKLRPGEIVRRKNPKKRDFTVKNLMVVDRRRHGVLTFSGRKHTAEHIAKRMKSKARTLRAKGVGL